MGIVKTEFTENLFSDNLHTQVLTYSSRQFHASLIEFDSSVVNALFAMEGNSVLRNSFIGENTALVYINGGVAHVRRNEFKYNGQLLGGEPLLMVKGDKEFYKHSHFPWQSYQLQEN